MPSLLMVDLGAVWGGQEIYSGILMQGMRDRGWQICSLSPHEHHRLPGIHHNCIPIEYRHFPGLVHRINALSPYHDVIHFNGIRSIYLSNLCSKRRPHVGTKHLPYSARTHRDIRTLVAQCAAHVVFRNLDRIIAISRAIHDELPASARRRCAVIPNGVHDIDISCDWDDTPSRLPLRLCYVGRLVEHKGIMRLLAAVRVLRTCGINFNLIVAGNGPLEDQAKGFVREHSLHEHVEFLGFVDHPAAVYRRSHVCVLPSSHEGMPLVLLEAASAGCALVGHDIPGITNVIVHGENGLLSPPSKTGLADTLGALACDLEALDRMRHRARRCYEANWRAERMVDDTESIYRELMQ